MRRFFFSALPCALFAALALWACGPSGAPSRPAGGAPRIVSLSPSITDILLALGAESQIVGTCAVPGRTAGLPGVPTVASLGTVNLERVVELRPDLCATVVAMQDAQALSDLRRAGIPVVQYPVGTLEELWVCMGDLGERAGNGDRGRELASRCRARVEAARGEAGGITARALLLVGDEPAVVAAQGTFLDEVLTAAGFTNAAAPRRGYPQLDLEGLALSRPEFLIFPEGDIASASAEALADAIGRITSRRPRTLGVPADTLVRPGPQTALAVEILARARGRGPAGGSANRMEGPP